MIRLTEAVLVRFGRFENQTLRFQEGLHVICGPNEAGKSTIQLFLRVMLYGVPNQRKTAGTLRDRERIIPWNEKTAEGILRLETDGRALEIRRRFGKTAAGDRTEILDVHTGEPVPGYTAEHLGEALMGVPAAVFEKTYWLRQEGASMAGKDEELSRRLLNLRDTGEEEISAERTLEELERAKRAVKARDRRSSPGRLDILRKEREEKLQEQYHLNTSMRQREAVQNRITQERQRLKTAETQAEELAAAAEVQTKLRTMDARLKKWEQAQLLREKAQSARNRKACQQFRDLTEEMVRRAEVLERNAETLDQNDRIGYDKEKANQRAAGGRKTEKTGWRLAGAGIGLLALALILAICRLPFWIAGTAAAGLAGLACAAAGLGRLMQGRREARRAAQELDALVQLAAQQTTEKEKNRRGLTELLQAYGAESAKALRDGMELCRSSMLEADSFQSAFDALMDGEDPEILRAEAEAARAALSQNAGILTGDFSGRLQAVRQTQMEAAVAVKELEGELSYVFRGGRNPADLEAELRQLDQDISEQEKELKAAEMAAEVFSLVYEKRKSDFTPLVNARVNAYLDILTSGKYKDVRVSQDYRLQLAPRGTALHEAEYFSRGTFEQIYFALRAALGELIGTGGEPLFLDDFLMAYDDTRAKAALELLKRLAEKRQILLFTCHRRDVENAAETGAAISHLEEEIEHVC